MSDELIARIVPWVSLVSLGLLATGVLAAATSLLSYLVLVRRPNEEGGRPQPCPKIAAWLRVPRVLVHASCPVELWRVDSALQFWRDLGHSVGFLETVNDMASVRGAILIVGHRSHETSAVTQISRRSWSDGVDLGTVSRGDHYCRPDEVISVFADGQIDHAVVIIPRRVPGMNMDLLLIHMIGHALGFAHAGSAPPGGAAARTKNHVMSALLSESGWVTEGLGAAQGRRT